MGRNRPEAKSNARGNRRTGWPSQRVTCSAVWYSKMRSGVTSTYSDASPSASRGPVIPDQIRRAGCADRSPIHVSSEARPRTGRRTSAMVWPSTASSRTAGCPRPAGGVCGASFATVDPWRRSARPPSGASTSCSGLPPGAAGAAGAALEPRARTASKGTTSVVKGRARRTARAEGIPAISPVPCHASRGGASGLQPGVGAVDVMAAGICQVSVRDRHLRHEARPPRRAPQAFACRRLHADRGDGGDGGGVDRAAGHGRRAADHVQRHGQRQRRRRGAPSGDAGHGGVRRQDHHPWPAPGRADGGGRDHRLVDQLSQRAGRVERHPDAGLPLQARRAGGESGPVAAVQRLGPDHVRHGHGRPEDRPPRQPEVQDVVNRPPRRAREVGLTLVELMVTMVIAGLVTSSSFLFFAGQRRVYDAQMKVLGVQQHLWAAMDTLARFVRAEGTGMIGCVNATDPTPPGAPPPQTGLRVYSGGAMARLAPLWIQNGANGPPDSITVVFGSGTFGNFSDVALGASIQRARDPVVPPVGLTTAFRVGEFVLALDTTGLPAGPPLGDRGCTVYQITGIDAAGNTLQKASTSPWNPPGDVPGLVPFDYVGGVAPTTGQRDIGTQSWVQIIIDSSGASPRQMLARLDGLAGPTPPQE